MIDFLFGTAATCTLIVALGAVLVGPWPRTLWRLVRGAEAPPHHPPPATPPRRAAV